MKKRHYQRRVLRSVDERRISKSGDERREPMTEDERRVPMIAFFIQSCRSATIENAMTEDERK